MTRLSYVLAVVLLVAVSAWTIWTPHRADDGAADTGAPSAAATAVTSLDRRASHGRRYHAEVVSAMPLAAGVPQRWTIHLTRRGHRRVSGARLTVRSWAPETGEVSPMSASSHDVGGGRYRIDGIYFPRPGWWNVAVVINAAGRVDSVAFNVVVPAAASVR